MYKMFKGLLLIIWVMDILNLSCVSFLDTVVPINFMAWAIIWILLPSSNDIND